MRLFTETNFDDVEVLIESAGQGKQYYIKGPFLQGNIKNRNKRNYPIHILENEVQRYTASHINENMAWGELGHPQGPTINLDRVSHRIVELKQEGNDFIGKARLIVTNPTGRIAMNLLEDGGKLGVSSRALGSLREIDGVNFVQEDFWIATAADIVADPSAPGAFVHGLMEGKEYLWDNGILKESVISGFKTTIEDTFKPNAKNVFEARCDAFRDFMEQLGNAK